MNFIHSRSRDNQEKLEKNITEIILEKDTYLKQMNEFQAELAEVKLQHAQLQSSHEKTLTENAESIRNLKV